MSPRFGGCKTIGPAAVNAYPESEDAVGAIHSEHAFVYGLGPTPLLDAFISSPRAVDAR
jgi:hypothetical protein